MSEFDNIQIEDRVEIVEPRDQDSLMGEKRFLGALARSVGQQIYNARNMFKRGCVKAVYPHPYNVREMIFEVLIDGELKVTGFKRTRLRKLNVLELIAEEVAAGDKEDAEKATQGEAKPG